MTAVLIRLIAFLFAALLAPATMIARVAHLDRWHLEGLARFLSDMQRRGRFLRYDGEDESIVAARIERAKWIAKDPVAALKHVVRQCRDPLVRARFGMVVPPGGIPPAPPIAPCAPVMGDAPAPDTS